MYLSSLKTAYGEGSLFVNILNTTTPASHVQCRICSSSNSNAFVVAKDSLVCGYCDSALGLRVRELYQLTWAKMYIASIARKEQLISQKDITISKMIQQNKNTPTSIFPASHRRQGSLWAAAIFGDILHRLQAGLNMTTASARHTNQHDSPWMVRLKKALQASQDDTP